MQMPKRWKYLLFTFDCLILYTFLFYSFFLFGFILIFLQSKKNYFIYIDFLQSKKKLFYSNIEFTTCSNNFSKKSDGISEL